MVEIQYPTIQIDMPGHELHGKMAVVKHIHNNLNGRIFDAVTTDGKAVTLYRRQFIHVIHIPDPRNYPYETGIDAEGGKVQFIKPPAESQRNTEDNNSTIEDLQQRLLIALGVPKHLLTNEEALVLMNNFSPVFFKEVKERFSHIKEREDQ